MSSVALAGNVASAAALRARSEDRTAWLLAAPAIVLLLLFVLLPVAAVIFLGFTDFELGYGKFRFVGFENYAHLLNDRTFRRSLWNTSVYTAIVAPVSIMLGLLVPIHATALPLYVAFDRMSLLNSYTSLVAPFTISVFAIFMAEDGVRLV